MSTDKEILDEIEKIVDLHMKFMYDKDNNSDNMKVAMSSFYIGQIMGTIMRRNKT